MALFVIGDTHLSFGTDKPMDIFKGWEGYTTLLEDNWRREICDEDTVVVAGDISWGMDFETALPDLQFIHNLPGKKFLLKGNHDYWWTTAAKMNAFFEENDLNSLSILHNNSYTTPDGISLCGTRGWVFESGQAQDTKVMNREAGRLEMSLKQAQTDRIFAFLHYPPLCEGASAPALLDLLEKYKVEKCFYGHLHNTAVYRAVQGRIGAVEYKLISADALRFCPFKIETEKS